MESRPRSAVRTMLLLTVLGSLVFGGAPHQVHAQEQVTLPIEVYAPDGTSAHVESVTLQASNGSSTDEVYFVMHQPRYHIGGLETGTHEGFTADRMVDVRLNGGTWVTVNNSNVQCAYPESNYDCITGPYHTLRFSMDASELGGAVDGANTLEFRFNGLEAVRSGFRVLYVGFMRPGDDVNTFVPLPKSGATESLIDGTTFQYSDADSWSPPSDADDAQSINEGETLFKTGNIQNLKGENIVATCGSCHADDGRDLQYFAYSNKTITARARAHGMTETEGKKIAAYIRSLDFTRSDGGSAASNSPGRPWNPPYQPGPTGFGPDGNQHPDEADAYYWAAGAGLEWILDRDIETAQYAFPASGDPASPGGVAKTPAGDLPWRRYKIQSKSEWGGNGGTDRGTAVNLREIPLSVQLPDWNNWLPDIHPHDGLDKIFDGSEYAQELENAESTFQSGNLEDIANLLNQFNGRYQQDIKLNIDPNNPGANSSNNLTQTENRHAIESGWQHRAVKLWYLQHKYNVEDKADDLYCDDSNDEWCEPRGWLSRKLRLVFDLGPHVSKTLVNDEPFIYGSQKAGQFMTHVWYQLQMITNPGTGGNIAQNPVDEGYQESYLETACRRYEVGCGLRQALSEWKFLQIHSHPGNGRGGITPQHSDPDRILHAAELGGNKSEYWVDTWRNAQEKSEVVLWIEAYIRALNAYMVGENGNEGRIATLDRADDPTAQGNTIEWHGIEYNPPYDEFSKDNNYSATLLKRLAGTEPQQSGPLDEVFPRISTGAIDSLAAQGDLLTPDDRDDGYPGEVTNSWPDDGRPRWHDVVDFFEQKVDLDSGWNFVSLNVAPSDSSMDHILSGVEGVSVVKDAEGRAYLPQMNIDQIETWSTREGYIVHVETGQNASFTGNPVARDRPIQLEEGWNLLPYYPDAPMDAATALASIEDVVKVVRNENRKEYIPAQSNDIGNLVPGEAYAIYVTSDVTFVYPSPN